MTIAVAFSLYGLFYFFSTMEQNPTYKDKEFERKMSEYKDAKYRNWD